MGFCKGIAKCFLYLVTLITGVMGVAMLGMAAYVHLNYASDFADLMSARSVMIVLICGVALFLISFIGFFGAQKQNKCALFLYFVVVFVILIAQIAAGVGFASYMGAFNDVQSIQNNEEAQKLQSENEKVINNFLLSAYKKCCYDNDEQCSGVGWVKVFSGSVGACFAVPNCFDEETVPSAANIQKNACFYENDKNPGSLTTPPAAPFLFEGKTICTAITEAGGPTCGDAAAEVGGVKVLNPKAYSTAMYTWFKSNVNFLGMVGAAIGGIELLALLFTCVLFWANKEEFDDYV